MLQDIKLKNRLYAKKLKQPTTKNKEAYRQQLKIVEKHKKTAKRLYFKNELEKYNSNVKKKWDVLREIILKKKKIDNINFINHNDTIITDKTKISEVFADHFQNIGSSLASKFEGISNRKFQRWLYRSPRPPENFKFREIIPEEVAKEIQNLDVSKGAGVDEISPKLIKEGKDELTLHLTNLYNMSIKTGIFPQCHKLARCVPIFKWRILFSYKL